MVEFRRRPRTSQQKTLGHEDHGDRAVGKSNEAMSQDSDLGTIPSVDPVSEEMEMDCAATTGTGPHHIITTKPQDKVTDRLNKSISPSSSQQEAFSSSSTGVRPSQDIETNAQIQPMDDNSCVNMDSTGLNTTTNSKRVTSHSSTSPSAPNTLPLRNTSLPLRDSSMESSSSLGIKATNAKNHKSAVVASSRPENTSLTSTRARALQTISSSTSTHTRPFGLILQGTGQRSSHAPSTTTDARPLQAISSNASLHTRPLGLILKRRRSASDLSHRSIRAKRIIGSEPTEQLPAYNNDKGPQESPLDAPEKLNSFPDGAEDENAMPKGKHWEDVRRGTENKSVMPPPPLPERIAGKEGDKEPVPKEFENRVKMNGLDKDEDSFSATYEPVKTNSSSSVATGSESDNNAKTSAPHYLSSTSEADSADLGLFNFANVISRDSKISGIKHKASTSNSFGPTPIPAPENSPQGAYHDGETWRCETCDLALHQGRCPSRHRIERCEECDWELLGGKCPQCAIDDEVEKVSIADLKERDTLEGSAKSNTREKSQEVQYEGMEMDDDIGKETRGVKVGQKDEGTEENGDQADRSRNMENEVLLGADAKIDGSEIPRNQEAEIRDPEEEDKDADMSQEINVSSITSSEEQFKDPPRTVYDPLEAVFRCALCTHEIETDDGIQAYCSGPDHHIIAPAEIIDWEPAYASSEDDSEDEESDSDDNDFLSDNEDDPVGAQGIEKRLRREEKVQEGNDGAKEDIEEGRAAEHEKDQTSSSTISTATSDTKPTISTTLQSSTPNPIAEQGLSVLCFSISISSPLTNYSASQQFAYSLVLNSTSTHLRIYENATKLHPSISIASISRIIYSLFAIRFELHPQDPMGELKVTVDVGTDFMRDEKGGRRLVELIRGLTEVDVVRVDT